MTKVYVLIHKQCGYTEEDRTLGVFSSFDKAFEYAVKALRHFDYWDVDEYNLDEEN